jgi:uncharacterized membrane protein YtjA (UPF0391 family)
MLRAALAFFVIALVAMILGATGMAGISMDIAQTILVVFLVLAAISFVAGIVSGRKPNVIP